MAVCIKLKSHFTIDWSISPRQRLAVLAVNVFVVSCTACVVTDIQSYVTAAWWSRMKISS